jgi:hypothetical protein
LPVSLREQTQAQLFVFAYLQRIRTPSRHSARRSRSPSTLMSASLRRFHSNRYRSLAAAVIVQSAGLLRREVTTYSRPIWICQSSPVSVAWTWIDRGLLTFGARRGPMLLSYITAFLYYCKVSGFADSNSNFGMNPLLRV